MSKQLQEYFEKNNLFDPNVLKTVCEDQGVEIITSEKYPDLVMLHYKTREVHFANKWTEFNKKCRGVIIDTSKKKVLVHPFEKFFNLHEQPENQLEVLLKLGEFEVSEKLDGSMIMLFKDPASGEYKATTKGSFDSEHGAFATQIIPDSLKNDNLHKRYSLIFELIERRFQIVVNYEKKGYKPGLYLIGARDNETGELLSFGEVQKLAEELNIPALKVYEYSNLIDVVEASKSLPVLEEGYVIRFKVNGHLVKLKGDEYLTAHRFISCLSPKYIIEALGEGITPEALEDAAPEEYKEDVKREAEGFINKFRELTDKLKDLFHEAPKEDRKSFAMWVNSNTPADMKGFMFKLYDNKNLDTKKVYSVIAKREGVSGDTKI